MENYMEILGKRAKEAAREAAKLGTEEKNRGLLTVAEELISRTEWILEENAKDLKEAEARGMKKSLIVCVLLKNE